MCTGGRDKIDKRYLYTEYFNNYYPQTLLINHDGPIKKLELGKRTKHFDKNPGDESAAGHQTLHSNTSPSLTLYW